MARIGVGVGEDFPIEDRPPSGGDAGPGPHEYNPYEDRHAYCGWGGDGGGYEDWRARRAEWRQQRRERRRRFRDEMRARGYGRYRGPFFPLFPLLIAAFVITLLIAGLVTVVAAAPFVALGLVLLIVLHIAHRRHYRSTWDYPPPPSGPSHPPSAPAAGQGS